MNKIDNVSMDLRKLYIAKIKEIFPSVVSEEKVDFDKLKLILGDDIDDKLEKYQFTWNGKSAAINRALIPSVATFVPSKVCSKNWDKTENIYIEGDNLEALKLLQKTYYGKIKMIYMDPPYNTGTNLIYKNKFEVGIEKIKELQNDEFRFGGVNFKNTVNSASFHTDWLNMMYSRIVLAKNLLRNDGVMVMAIDHNEIANLIKISDEIFGESNRIGIVTVVHKPEGRNQEKHFATSNEYALFYAKNIDLFEFEPAILDEQIEKSFNLMDSKGRYRLNDLMRVKDGTHLSNVKIENFHYPIYVSKDFKNISIDAQTDSHVVYPVSKSGRKFRWRMVKESLKPLIEQGEIVAEKNKNGDVVLYQKYRIDNGQLIKTHWTDSKYNATTQGTKVLDALMNQKTFDFPKSLLLMEDILKITTKKESIILDFFSGSATTAHAVMKLNAEDGGNRKFIMVQLPEMTDEKSEAYKAGYKNICEIGKERIRRAGEQVKKGLASNYNNSEIAEGNTVNPESLDVGFKVFKLESTNIVPWDGSIKLDDQSIFSQIEVIKEGRNNLDVLYEIMLKYGVFDKQIQEVSINDKIIYSISKGYLIVCLEDNITADDVKEIGKLKPNNVLFKESGFKDDNDKINATYTLENMGVKEIKSI